MAASNQNFTMDDVMQAIVAALEFGESGVGIAALELLQDHVAGRPTDTGWVNGERACVVCGPCEVRMSTGAMSLLGMAQGQRATRAIALRYMDGHTVYDLRE